MRIQVIINDHLVYEEPAEAYTVARVADLLADGFRVGLLKKCGVSAEIRIVGVQSRMNSATFTPEPEAYDERYFKEIFEY